jgi:YbbR domain-containing protein
VRAALSRNPGLKLFSLLLAFFLWFSINVSERDAERDVKLPITVRRLGTALIVTNLPANPVTARVRGPRTILDGVDTRESRLTLDLASAGPGDRTIELSPDMVRPDLPRRLKVVRLEPPRLKVHIEALVSRTVPVRVEVAGMPPLGYTVAGTAVGPDEVKATGPANRVNDLKEIKTEPVDVSGSTEPFQRDGVLLSWAGDFVTFAPDHVKVTLTVKQVMMSREFSRVDVRILNAEGVRAQLFPSWVDLTVTGPQRTLHNYEFKEGAVYVDAAGLKPGDHQVSVKVDLPPALELETKRPEEHRLRISGRGGR